MSTTAKEKSEAAIAIGLAIYARMVRLSHDSNQVVGEKRDYYVTLEQLEAAFVSIRDELRNGASDLRNELPVIPPAKSKRGWMGARNQFDLGDD